MGSAKVGQSIGKVKKSDSQGKLDTLGLILNIVREQKTRLDQVFLRLDENDRKRIEGQAERKAEAAEVRQMISDFKTHYEEMKDTYDFVQNLVKRMQRWGRPLLWGIGAILSAVFAMLKIIDWFKGHK